MFHVRGITMKGLMYYSPRMYEVMIRLAHLGSFNDRIRTVRGLVGNSHVIELGCGTASMYEFLDHRSYVGLDLNSKFVSYAAAKGRNAKYEDVFNYGKYLNVEGSTVLLMDILHHIPDHGRLLEDLVSNEKVMKVVICEPYNVPGNPILSSTLLNRIFDADGINGVIDWYCREDLTAFLKNHGAIDILEIKGALLTGIDTAR